MNRINDKAWRPHMSSARWNSEETLHQCSIVAGAAFGRQKPPMSRSGWVQLIVLNSDECHVFCDRNGEDETRAFIYGILYTVDPVDQPFRGFQAFFVALGRPCGSFLWSGHSSLTKLPETDRIRNPAADLIDPRLNRCAVFAVAFNDSLNVIFLQPNSIKIQYLYWQNPISVYAKHIFGDEHPLASHWPGFTRVLGFWFIACKSVNICNIH